MMMRNLAWIGAVGLGLVLAPPVPSEETKAAKVDLTNYFPPPESKGGWRTLLPEKGEPSADQKVAIAKTAGLDWDKLGSTQMATGTPTGRTVRAQHGGMRKCPHPPLLGGASA
jgi:hypothetical protein